MKAEQIAQVLSETDLLRGIDKEILRGIAERVGARRYRKREILFHEGDLGDALFVLSTGLVKLFRTSEDGDEIVLATLRPYETFGELALIDGGPRSASAIALADTTAVLVRRDVFRNLLLDYPVLLEQLQRSLGSLLRRLLEQTSDLVFLDLPGRVAKLLLGLAEKRGRMLDGVTVLDLEMSQSDLAGMVGGSRPSVNQILRSFEVRGYVEISGKSVILRRPEKLRARAGL